MRARVAREQRLSSAVQSAPSLRKRGGGVGWDLRRVQHDEAGFVLHDRVLPPARHLGDAVDAARQDRGERQRQRGDEEPEGRARADVRRLRLERPGAGAADADEVGEGERGEDEERADLEGEAGHHDVLAVGQLREVERARGGGRRGGGAAGGLQDERDEVAGYEDVGVAARGEVGEGGAGCEDAVVWLLGFGLIELAR